jgi:hypothetical protein
MRTMFMGKLIIRLIHIILCDNSIIHQSQVLALVFGRRILTD